MRISIILKKIKSILTYHFKKENKLIYLYNIFFDLSYEEKTYKFILNKIFRYHIFNILGKKKFNKIT